jgi:hypothetical protein
MSINPLETNVFIDSCAFDPKYYPENEAAEAIFKLYKKEEGNLLHIAHSVKKEIDHPNTPIWVKNEAMNMIITGKVGLTNDDLNLLYKIEKILAGNGKVENILQDARHIFEAQRYGDYFITTDSRILSRTHELRLVCDVIILKPSNFLSVAKDYLNKENNG